MFYGTIKSNVHSLGHRPLFQATNSYSTNKRWKKSDCFAFNWFKFHAWNASTRHKADMYITWTKSLPTAFIPFTMCVKYFLLLLEQGAYREKVAIVVHCPIQIVWLSSLLTFFRMLKGVTVRLGLWHWTSLRLDSRPNWPEQRPISSSMPAAASWLPSISKLDLADLLGCVVAIRIYLQESQYGQAHV